MAIILHKDITVLLSSMQNRNWAPDDYMLKGLIEISDKLHKLDEYDSKFIFDESIELKYDGEIAGSPEDGTMLNICKYNDCGWCYAPTSIATTSSGGMCNKPSECKGRFK